MQPLDAKKIAFRTLMDDFYYIVMPFGKKNVGATYQRAMTTIFHNILHDCLEDYGYDHSLHEINSKNSIIMTLIR